MRTNSKEPYLSIGLLVLRLVIGVVFVFHGGQIAFGFFGGPGPQAFAAMTHNPLPVAWAVGLGQFLSGVAFLIGFPTDVAAVSIMIIMAGAIVLVHWPIFALPKGMEYALTQFVIALAILLMGPGRYSIQACVPKPMDNSTAAKADV